MPHNALDLTGLRVLVVDDDDDVRKISLLVLDGRAAHSLGVDSARAAEVFLADHEVDVIVTDMVMPGLTGRQFLDWLTAEHPAIPVVAMSGVPDQLFAAAQRPNVRSTLDKPFTVDALLDAVQGAVA